MRGKQPFLILSLLVLCVFLLRKPHKDSLRRLQTSISEDSEDSTNTTFATSVAEKLCSSYVYSDPTPSRQKEAASISADISELRSQHTFKDLIEEGEIQQDLVDAYLSKFVPFILALGIPFAICTALFILCVVNWSCMVCPSCTVLRCGICDRPNTKSSINCYAFLSILFSLLVLGASIAGIILFNDLTPKVDGTVCQVTYMMQEMYDGVPDTHWFGINPLQRLLGTIGDDLYATNRMFRDVDRNFTSMKRKIDQISDDLNYVDTGFRNDSITRANFMEENGYTPQFVTTLRETMDVAFESVDWFDSNLTQARDMFDDSVSDFTSKRDEVLSNVDAGTTQARGIARDLNSTLRWLNDNGGFVHEFAKGLTIAIRISLGILIGFAGFAFFSVLVAFWTKYKHMAKCVHLSWFVVGFFMVIAWISAALLFPATVACVETCQVVDAMITNDTFANMSLNSVFGEEQSSLKDSILICMHGSGKIIDNFEIKDKMDLLPQIIEALDDASVTVFDNELPTAVDISPLKARLASIADNSEPDDAKTEIDLALLNTYNHLDVNTDTRCADVYDQWVLNTQRCETLELSDVLDNSDPDLYGLGDEVCIPLQGWELPVTRNISERYTDENVGNCPSVVNPNNGDRYSRTSFVRVMVNRFVRNRNELGMMISNINLYVDNVDFTANQLIAEAKDTVRAPFNVVKDFVVDLEELVFHRDTGLLYNTECKFVRERIDHLNNELCVNLIPTIYNTAISLIIGSVMASLLTFVLFFMTRKLMSKQIEYYQNKTYPQ